MPFWPIEPTDAVTLLKTEQRAIHKAGHMLRRATWRGFLHGDCGQPRVRHYRRFVA